MTVGRGLRATAALAVVLAAAIAAPLAAADRYSFRNSAPVPDELDAQFRLTMACLPWTTGPTTGSVAYAQALKTARSLVKPSSDRFEKIEKTKFFDKPVRAEGGAAMALLKGSPKGALASLLASLEEKPNDPVLLLDAGVMLVKLGKPREGLAFINRAASKPAPPSGGLPWPALVNANKALAYVALKKYDLAASRARSALTAAPWLVEARETLAAALFCGGSPADGICELRSAQRRPLESDEEPLTCAAAIGRDLRDGDFGDLSTGPDGTLPHVPTPATVDVAPSYVDTYADMSTQIAARSTQRTTRLLQLPTLQAAWHQKASPASRQRTEDLVQRWSDELASPEHSATLIHLIELQGDAHQVLLDMDENLVEDNATCADADDFELCFRELCGPQFHQQHLAYLNAFNALNDAVREEWKTLGAMLRGIQRNVESAPYNEYLALLTDIQSETFLGMLITAAGEWPTAANTWKEECLEEIPDPPAPEPLGATTPIERCPGALNFLEAGIKLDASEVLPGSGPAPKAGITLKCSSVEFSLSWSPLPLLTGYGKLKIGFGPEGTSTLTFGSKAGALGTSFVSEIAVTADAKGNLRDATWNMGPKGPFGAQDLVSIPIVGSAVGP